MSHKRVTFIFNFLILIVFHIVCSTCPAYIPKLIILWLSVTELLIYEFYLIVFSINSHCAYAVSRDRCVRV